MSDAAALPFSRRLRLETRRAHSLAEKAGFVRGFLRGVIDVAHYRQLLVDLHHVYAEMERALDVQDAHPAVHAVNFPELRRVPALARDLGFFGGHRWEESFEPTGAARAYAARIREITFTAPALLVAHAYTRYLGDLSGGQILCGILRRSLPLPPDRGSAFYDFPAIADLAAFKQRFRARLDTLPADPATLDAIVAEANHVFQLNLQVFNELDGNAFTTLRHLLTQALSFNKHAA